MLIWARRTINFRSTISKKRANGGRAEVDGPRSRISAPTDIRQHLFNFRKIMERCKEKWTPRGILFFKMLREVRNLRISDWTGPCSAESKCGRTRVPRPDPNS